MPAPEGYGRRPGSVAAALDGKLVLPADDGWDEARRAWQLTVDQRPAAVVLPESAPDVAAAVLLARESGQRLAPQGPGHNASSLGPLDDTILLKTERMRGVTIDARARTARVAAGMPWRGVVEAAAQHGLVTLAGSSPDVGVAGYTLGGGISLIGRSYGLCANHVRAIEAVTADGHLVRADSDTEQDLFWALRGGGGSFGVATAFEFELFPLTQAYAGTLWFPMERGGEVLGAWRELTLSGPPDELSTIGRFMNFPPAPQVPEPVRGKSFALVEAYHVGRQAQADELLAPLRALGPVNDTIQTVAIPDLEPVHMDPQEPVPGTGDGFLAAELPADALDAFVEVAGAGARLPLVTVEVRHLEGELGRARPGHGALASLPARYCLVAGGLTPAPEDIGPAVEQVDAIKQALAPWTAPQMYLNFADTQRDPASLWSPEAYDRLRSIKAAVDPLDLIRANHGVPPES